MKTAIVLAALLTSATAQADTLDFCSRVRDIAYSTAQARDMGTDMAVALQQVERGAGTGKVAQMLRIVISAVYSSPDVPPVRISAMTFKACMDSFKPTGSL
jgi:hypothetical protein